MGNALTNCLPDDDAPEGSESEESEGSEASDASDESDDDEPRVFDRPEEQDDFQVDPKTVDLEKVDVIVSLVFTPALTQKLLHMGRRAFAIPPLPQRDFRERALVVKNILEGM